MAVFSQISIGDNQMAISSRIDSKEFRQVIGLFCVLLLFGCLARSASAVTRVIDLDGPWTEYDPRFGIGIQTLSDNTPAGFTSTHSGSVSAFQDRPRVIHEFDGLDVSQVGQSLTATFDVQFLTVPSTGGNAGDTRFRFGFGDRTTNQGLVPLMVDLGQTSGSSFRQRYDSSLTDDESEFIPDTYSGFLSASGTFGSGGGNPTSPGNSAGEGGIRDTIHIHTFTITAERVERNVDRDFPPDGIADEVVNGWYTSVSWTSDEPGAETAFVDVNNADFADFDVDTGLGVYPEDVFNVNGRINNFDTLGFVIYTDDPFSDTGSAGSYSISNFVLEYEDGVAGASGDFDSNGAWDCADIDALATEIVAGTNAANFDLNGDGSVDIADRDQWLAEAGAINLASGNAYLVGDANLDGSVDVSDFNVWNGNRFSSTPHWCSGDFNTDGNVDVSDFNLWNNNQFLTADVSAVPEPANVTLLFIGIMGLMPVIRRSR